MKKKVYFFIKSLGIGGTERVLIAYLRGLEETKKYEIKLIVGKKSKKNILIEDVPKSIEIEYIADEKVDNFLDEVSRKRKNNLLYRVLNSILVPLSKRYRKKRILDIVKRDKIDVLVDFEKSFVKWAEQIKCKTILWNHFTLSNLNEKEKKQYCDYLKKYNYIIAISNEMLFEIKKIYSNFNKLKMLYNPQSFDKIIYESTNQNRLSENAKKLLNDSYLIYVGRIEKIKGLEDLIEAYDIIKNEINEKLYIVGDGKELEKLKMKVKEMNLEEKILFLGNQNNPYIWMKNSKLFVTTTYGEGLPTTYIESMICGTPVLSYDSPTGPKDILGDGKYGALVKKGDVSEFSSKLKELLENEKYIKNYKKNMMEKLEEFKIENIIEEFQEIIESV